MHLIDTQSSLPSIQLSNSAYYRVEPDGTQSRSMLRCNPGRRRASPEQDREGCNAAIKWSRGGGNGPIKDGPLGCIPYGAWRAMGAGR